MAKRKIPATPVDPTLPTEVQELQAQLKLARTSNAHLHRQLCLAKQQVPMGDHVDAGTDVATLEAANADLRWRLSRLEAHFAELKQAKSRVEWELDELRKLGASFFAFRPGSQQAGLGLSKAPSDFCEDLTGLLRALHPDKWGGSDPVAVEATKLINALRERYAQPREGQI